MDYRLWIENEAKAEIRRLPGHVRQRIRRAVQDLRSDSRPHNSRQLKVPQDVELEVRRLRLDHWRIVYVVDQEWTEIGVLAVRKCPPYTYDDLANLLAELE
jgi:mRNA interferase RelE/StbE